MEQLELFQQKMVEQNINAYIIPTNDYHGSEYVGDFFKGRNYLSGFTGSAGTLVVLQNKSYLWTDGRYYIQASKQIEGNNIELMKMDQKDVPSIIEFLVNTLKPGDILKVPTGIKCIMEDDDVLFLLDRGSMGFKYNVRFCNQVGVIDKDYYGNPDNEGHIWIRIQNEGDKDYVVKKDDRMCQGIFMKYLLVDEDNDEYTERRSDY